MEKKAVLITGAGPTGLTLANLLARMEIPFYLIDKKKEPSRDSKAFAIHARSLEIFSQLEIAEKAIGLGSVDNTVHLVIKDKEKTVFRLKNFISGKSNYPYLLVLAQNKTEQLLIDSLKLQNQSVHWQHELLGFESHKTGVEAVIKTPSGGKKLMEFRYLAGCDGAGSTVREAADIPFKGKTFSNTFYLADCEIDWKFSHGDIYFLISPDHLSGIFSFSEKGKYRIFNFINTSVDKEVNTRLETAEVQKIADSNPHVGMRVRNMEWSSSFKIHMRYTHSFRKDNIFLAGDAAHVHTPAGGQGMNTGIQDAYNLAWKLGLVIKGKAKSRLLDTYSEERQPIAKNLHNATDRIFQLVTLDNKGMNAIRMYLFPVLIPVLFKITWFREKNLPRFSQLAIKYRYSSLNRGSGKKAFTRKSPKPGDRAPYCKINANGIETDIFQLYECDRFCLLIGTMNRGSKEASGVCAYFRNWEKLPLSVHLLTKSAGNGAFFNVYGIRKDSAVFIIRPDGHIGFRSGQIDQQEIEDYFTLLAGGSF